MKCIDNIIPILPLRTIHFEFGKTTNITGFAFVLLRMMSSTKFSKT